MGPGIGRTVAPRRPLHRRFLPATPRAEPPIPTLSPPDPHRPEHRPSWVRDLYPGEPETCRRDPRSFLINLTHLALLLGVFQLFKVEERPFQGHTFKTLVTLALLAMPAHYSRAAPLEEADLHRRIHPRTLPRRRSPGLGDRPGGRRRLHRRLLPTRALGRPRLRLRLDGGRDRLGSAVARRRRHPRRRLDHRRLDADVSNAHLPV